jgi:SPX domain protein involved in polyphosphate accumulation
MTTQADTGVKSSSSEKAKEQWQAPDMFKRQTTKYWCKPEHVVQLKVAIIKHLPLLVYDQRTRLAAGNTIGSLCRAVAQQCVHGHVH